MRVVVVLCALAVLVAAVTASKADVLTYVTCDEAESLRDKYTGEDRHMRNYWSKAAVWVCDQEGRSFPMDNFSDEYEKFESGYLKHLPRAVAVTMRMQIDESDKRMMQWMWFTK